MAFDTLIDSNQVANKTESTLADRTTQKGYLGPLSEFRSSQVMPNTARTIRRLDASICRHSNGVMGTDSSRYAAIVLAVVLIKAHILSITDF